MITTEKLIRIYFVKFKDIIVSTVELLKDLGGFLFLWIIEFVCWLFHPGKYYETNSNDECL